MAKITSGVERITPDVAERMLKLNKFNRPIREKYVEELTQSMKAERWKCNGEAIILSDEGTLLDGQHRLSAIIRSGKGFDMLVTRGISKEAFDTIDVGRKRTLPDVIIQMDLPRGQACTLTQALGWNEHYLRGYKNSDKLVQHWEVLEKASNKELLESVRFIHSYGRDSRIVPKGMAAFLHYHFSAKNPHRAESFFNKLYTGVELKSGDPVLALRNIINNNARSPKRYPQLYICNLIITAWNYAQKQKSLKHEHTLQSQLTKLENSFKTIK